MPAPAASERVQLEARDAPKMRALLLLLFLAHAAGQTWALAIESFDSVAARATPTAPARRKKKVTVRR